MFSRILETTWNNFLSALQSKILGTLEQNECSQWSIFSFSSNLQSLWQCSVNVVYCPCLHVESLFRWWHTLRRTPPSDLPHSRFLLPDQWPVSWICPVSQIKCSCDLVPLKLPYLFIDRPQACPTLWYCSAEWARARNQLAPWQQNLNWYPSLIGKMVVPFGSW